MAERDDDGMLARWSRRKAAARRGELAPEVDADASGVPDEQAPAAEAGAEVADPDPAPLELPDPDTLDASADFRIYMKPGVPPELKTRALRRLWRVNPFYNQHDGLDDCCGDFTDKARVVKDLKTVYRVGRGMIDRITEVADAGPQAPAPAAPEAAQAEAAPDTPRRPEELPVDHEVGPPTPKDLPVDHEAVRVAAPSHERPAPKAGGRPRGLPRRG